jgi:4-hydroxy-3-methylbut-2-enyl diphosphate reductase
MASSSEFPSALSSDLQAVLLDPRCRLRLEKKDDGSWDLLSAEALATFPFISSTAGYTIQGGDGEIAEYRWFLCPEDGVEHGLGEWLTLEAIEALDLRACGPSLHRLRSLLGPYVIQLPYLQMGDNDYIYRFRNDSQRNKTVYRIDERSQHLYDSPLCAAIKALRRGKERTAEEPALLDFGPVRYLLPSHFGFCLGVQNAIERAYETLVQYPKSRVFMLSELIHNPFVNEDLLARGLRYLQSDKGKPLTNPETGKFYWDELGGDDIVIIPAFGATDQDKERLIRKGIPIVQHDATCMLVEKVWKAARRFGQAGYTVVIHGKAEHEETKATFSNSSRYAPSLILRNLEEACFLAEVIKATDRADKERLFKVFEDKVSPGFDVEKDLECLAVVNQTTLLRNETLRIIDYLEGFLREEFGPEEASRRLHSKSRGDTLCYATQVNQDALGKALTGDVDFAFVVGGKNSSNTFQLFRICEDMFAERAFYVQSEREIHSAEEVDHYRYSLNLSARIGPEYEPRPFLTPPLVGEEPVTILITGGASCPDGLIQQLIQRINSFFPADELRSEEEVLEMLLASEE